jgi:hypothetical protein
MVFPERNYTVAINPHVPDLPSLRGVVLGSTNEVLTQPPSTPAIVVAPAFIEISYRGQRAQIARSDDCECVNPWETYTDPLGASTCSVSGAVTVCLVKTSTASGTISSLSAADTVKQAQELLAEIDAEFKAEKH